jgi:hypothetical protein
MKKTKNVNELIKINELMTKKGDVINIMTPPFEREYELSIDFKPKNSAELKALIETCPADILQKMGVCVFSNYNESKDDIDNYLKPGEIHYLFPGEWYGIIPNGFEIIDIFGNKKTFKKNLIDDDICYGCLLFGFIRLF